MTGPPDRVRLHSKFGDPEVKAFIVQEPNEYRGGVIFAKHDIEARKRGANEFNDGELAGMMCKRAPDIDHMNGDHRAVTWALLERGWWFDDGKITLDECPTVFVTKGGGVYRSPYDWLSDRERVIRYRANSSPNRDTERDHET